MTAERIQETLDSLANTMSFICVKEGEESLICNGTRYDLHEEELNYKDGLFWVYLGVYVGLVLFAGLYFVILSLSFAENCDALHFVVGKRKKKSLFQLGLN